MKTVILFLLGACLSLSSIAQSISEGDQSFMKKQTANALNITVEGQPKNVKAVLEKQFKAGTGKKGKGMKGVTAYEGVMFSPISTSTIDLYYTVAKQSRKDANHSRVNLFLSSGNYNFMESRNYPDEMAKARLFLEGLQNEITVYELELAIKDQEKTIKHTIKDHEKMGRDSVSLQNRLIQTQEDIETNKNDRENGRLKIQEEQVRLEEFRQELDFQKRKTEDEKRDREDLYDRQRGDIE